MKSRTYILTRNGKAILANNNDKKIIVVFMKKKDAEDYLKKYKGMKFKISEVLVKLI